MPVSVNDSYVVEKALDYAKLCELSKANWVWNSGEWVLDGEQYGALWDEMRRKNYLVLCFEDKTQDTGYSGTLFYNSAENRAILANRSTDGFDDTAADISIAAGNVPAEQFRSMVEFITYCQSIYNQYLQGFDVTGHSLGGCLAQMAAGTFVQQVNAVYTYNAPGALNLAQNVTLVPDTENQGYVTVRETLNIEGQIISLDKIWKKSSWDLYIQFFEQRASVHTNNARIYNISGIDGSTLIADHGPDIGREVFIGGNGHFLDNVRTGLATSPFYIDNRQPVTVIGSNRNEIFYGNYNSWHYLGQTPQNVTLVGGYGSDILGGSDGDDELYGDLPKEMLNDTAARRISGNLDGSYVGDDILIGGKGNDILDGGDGYDTYRYGKGDGNDRIIDSDNRGRIVVSGFFTNREIELASICVGNL